MGLLRGLRRDAGEAPGCETVGRGTPNEPRVVRAPRAQRRAGETEDEDPTAATDTREVRAERLASDPEKRGVQARERPGERRGGRAPTRLGHRDETGTGAGVGR